MNALNDKFQDSLGSAAGRVKTAAQETLDTARGLAQSAARTVGNAAASSAGLTQSASRELLSGTAALATQLGQLPADVVDKMFPECPAPLFILPTGPDREEYSTSYSSSWKSCSTT